MRGLNYLCACLASYSLWVSVPAIAQNTNGDCKTGAESYAKVAQEDRDPRTAQRAVRLAEACNHLPAAWQAAQRLYDLDPENVEALRQVGTVALQIWRIDDARRIFAELLAKPDVELDLALADILPALIEVDEAPAAWMVFGKIVDRRVASLASLSLLAKLALAADDLAGCESLIVTARTKGGGNDAVMVRLSAAIAAGRGDDKTALAQARLVAQSDSANYRFATSETLISLDRLEEARAELENVTNDNDFSVESDRRLALLALSNGDLAEAQRRFSRRLQSKDTAGEAIFYLSLMAERLKRPEVALRGYEQIISTGSGLTARARAARILLARGDRAAAIKIFETLLQARRGSAIEIEIALSQALSEANFSLDAIKSIDIALSRYPEHPHLIYQRAILLERAGRRTEAYTALEKLLQHRPDDAWVMNALGYTLADHYQELPRAEKLIRAAVVQRPDSAAFLDSLGWVRFRRGDTQGALLFLERAWRLTHLADIAAHYGEVLWVSGDQRSARKVWTRALVSTPESQSLRAVINKFARDML